MTDETTNVLNSTSEQPVLPSSAPREPRKLGARDGLYQRKDRRGWWISYLDADGRRRRECASTDYRTAVMRRREIPERHRSW
jgi:hypothetical protein